MHKRVIRPLICCSQFTWQSTRQHAFSMLKEKQNRKSIPCPLRASTTIYFCNFKRKIDRDEAPDSPVRLSSYFDLDIECADVITSSCLCRFVSADIKDKARNFAYFLVIKFNMHGVICDFLREIKRRGGGRIFGGVYISSASFCIQRRNCIGEIVI